MFGRKDDLTGEGMTVFYKPTVVQPLATETFWLSETPDVPGSRSWGEGWIRCLTWARFFHVETKRTFYFFNTHLDTRGETVRLKEAECVIQRIEAIAGDSPAMLVADFNSIGGESPTWKAFQEAGFADARDKCKSTPKGSYGTWCGFAAPREEGRRIDWILLKGDMQIDEYATVNYSREGRFPSDHFPVIANVRICPTPNEPVHGDE